MRETKARIWCDRARYDVDEDVVTLAARIEDVARSFVDVYDKDGRLVMLRASAISAIEKLPEAR